MALDAIAAIVWGADPDLDPTTDDVARLTSDESRYATPEDLSNACSLPTEDVNRLRLYMTASSQVVTLGGDHAAATVNLTESAVQLRRWLKFFEPGTEISVKLTGNPCVGIECGCLDERLAEALELDGAYTAGMS